MSKIIEDKAQEFADINEDKACNYAFCYNKYHIADAYEHGADFGYGLAENRIKKEYEEKLRWIPIDKLENPTIPFLGKAENGKIELFKVANIYYMKALGIVEWRSI
jgi:hypothetical protein